MGSSSEIAEWFNGRSVFITGAAGFMGKVLLEKLLFGCPDIKTVYILLRPKRGCDPRQRVENMWKLPAFDRLRKFQPNAVDKIIPINGDLISENLGISDSDRQTLINEVTVIFHFAATLKLEGTLKDAVEMNTQGTQKVIDLCNEIKNLNAFVHLSTAFCNSDIEEMNEKVYNWRDNPHDVIKTVEWIPEKALVDATPSIISPHPNTYLYSKRLAELLVRDQYPKLPSVIVRPTIVCPAAAEPVGGWVDNLNGPIGLLVAAGKGVIRSMHCKPNYAAHVIPVDFAINAVIAIAWKIGTANQRSKEIPVYNLTQDGVRKITFGNILDIGRKIIYDNPFEGSIWYPGGDMRSNKIVHYIHVILFHFLPAYFIDLLMIIFRQRRFMVRLQWRIQQGLELLQFFTTRKWMFGSSNFLSLWPNLNKEDRERFSIDLESLDTEMYLTVCVLGARQYCMKEPLSSLPRCRTKQKFLYLLDKFVKYALLYYIINLILSWIHPFGFTHIMDFVDLSSNKIGAYLL